MGPHYSIGDFTQPFNSKHCAQANHFHRSISSQACLQTSYLIVNDNYT